MGGMPHLFQKGRLFTLADDRYTRSSPEQRIAWLNTLQAADGNGHLQKSDGKTSPLLTDLGTLDGSLPGANPGENSADHLCMDWLGLEKVPNTNLWTRHEGGSPTDPTGWWSGWTGNAHEIYRVGLVAMLEISLGLPHRDRDPISGTHYSIDDVRRCWPIEQFWTCPAPKFEVCVTWRDHLAWWRELAALCRSLPQVFDGGGQVTMVVSTPGSSFLEISRFLDRGSLIHVDKPNHHRHRYDSPLQSLHPRGLWIIGSNARVVPTSIQGDPSSPDDLSGLDPTGGHVISEDEVMVVRPAEYDGGILNDGRQYR